MEQKFNALKKIFFIKLIIIYSRYLIGFAFVWAAIVKMKGGRFTRIPPTEPVGYFFEALYQSGFYWNFLGWAQFIAGTLLMTQRFASLGAMIFFPIILNIFLITVSINFGSGTPLITGLMLLGTIGLLIWDYKKWVILFYPDHQIKLDLSVEPNDHVMTNPLWIVTGVLFILLTLAVQFAPNGTDWIIPWAVAMLFVGLAAVIIGLRNYRKQLSA